VTECGYGGAGPGGLRVHGVGVRRARLRRGRASCRWNGSAQLRNGVPCRISLVSRWRSIRTDREWLVKIH